MHDVPQEPEKHRQELPPRAPLFEVEPLPLPDMTRPAQERPAAILPNNVPPAVAHIVLRGVSPDPDKKHDKPLSPEETPAAKEPVTVPDDGPPVSDASGGTPPPDPPETAPEAVAEPPEDSGARAETADRIFDVLAGDPVTETEKERVRGLLL